MTIWYGEAGSGDPVVLLHAGVADSRMWRPQAEALAGHFRVITVDFRGFGRSPYEAAGPYSDSGDVAAVLDRLGLSEARLVGASYGARVALELAAQGYAGKLVLLNAGSDLPRSEDLKAFIAEENRLLELGEVQAAAELNADVWLGPEATAQTRARVVEMQARAFELQLGHDLEQEEVAVDPAAVDVPALVVTGAHDLLHFRQSGPHLAGRLPQGRLVELGWAGHLPSMERPEEITRLLLDYL
ncbi:alpha/beta fold hydrolase [Nonomuraea typhae]|uniref:alpha/beta fold hydrolase n=1 Tax=Nonomuraea typhae TaxID=2603600 RepID=UPI0012FCE179|nr:alpha/beta hydrolase [Nonomuraea typhae]